MKLAKFFTAGCLAAALGAGNLLAQDEPVEVRIRAVTDKDGKVEVVEERIVGAEKSEKPGKSTAKSEVKEVEEETVKGRVIRRLQGLAGNVLERVEAATSEQGSEWGELPQSDYWIGVQIAPVAPEIRKHLTVKHGILVLHVYPESPAAKAEVQADDILIQAGELKLETGHDLIKAVDAAGTKELTFKVLREGKETTATLQPVKREAAKTLTLTRPAEGGLRLERLQAAQKQFEKALEALRAETEGEAAVDFMLVRPGAFMSRASTAKAPDDLTIQITKEGNKPAKIHVKQGDKSWDVAADKLDELPKEIRPFVEQMASGGGNATFMVSPPGAGPHFQMKVAPFKATTIPGVPAPPVVVPYPPAVHAVPAHPAIPGVPAVAPRATVTWSAAAPHGGTDAKLDQILKKLDALASPDLDEMKKELQALRKEVDELRKKASGSESGKER